MTKLLQNSVVYKACLDYGILLSFENNHNIPRNIQIFKRLFENQHTACDT